MPRPDSTPPAQDRAAAAVSLTDRVLCGMAALSVAAGAAVTAMTFAVASPALPAAAAVDAEGATNGVCPTLTAGTWQLPYAPYTKGTVYDVKVSGYACNKADGYVKKLVTEKVGNGIPATLKGGPKGWTCTASKSKTGLAYTGQCSKKFPSIGGTFFAWSVG